MLNWLTWFRWATLMLVFGAASYYGYQTTPWSCVDTTVTAYWVQAIGSVAAILGAVEIFRRQNIATSRLAVRERQSNIHQRQISVYAICVAAYELIEELHRCHQVDSKFGGGVTDYYQDIYSEHAFSNAEAALAAIPLHDLHSYFLTTGILDLRNALAQVPAFVETRDGSDDTNNQYDASTYGYLPRIYNLAHRGFSQIQTGTDKARERFPVNG